MNLAQSITIDRGVPMPPKWADKFKYPWLEMRPGDSFLWPKSYQHAWTACKQRRARHGEVYRIAKVTEDGKHMIRIWRVG